MWTRNYIHIYVALQEENTATQMVGWSKFAHFMGVDTRRLEPDSVQNKYAHTQSYI